MDLEFGPLINGAKADVWGLGLLLYICVAGRHPFFDIADESSERLEYCRELTMCALRGVPPPSPPIPPTVDGGAPVLLSLSVCELLRGMLEIDPQIRWDLHRVAAHPWVKTGETFDTPLPPGPPTRKIQMARRTTERRLAHCPSSLAEFAR
eukprot:GHVT01065277.1.p1 GENE.GHVT01065277.1~~GHVT01065277.1.p1  ORF type:complete len:151 (-),score=16.23 GHVT01065277.1:281-733(-)